MLDRAVGPACRRKRDRNEGRGREDARCRVISPRSTALTPLKDDEQRGHCGEEKTYLHNLGRPGADERRHRSTGRTDEDLHQRWVAPMGARLRVGHRR